MRLHMDGPTIYLHTDGQTPAGTRLPDRYDEGSHQDELAAIGVLSEYIVIGSVKSAALVFFPSPQSGTLLRVV